MLLYIEYTNGTQEYLENIHAVVPVKDELVIYHTFDDDYVKEYVSRSIIKSYSFVDPVNSGR